MLSIEALSVSLSLVSISPGNGGVVIGEDFAADSIETFEDEILRYSMDWEYYKNQSKKAYERGQYLQDTNRAFCDTVRKFVRTKVKDGE